MRYRDYQPDQMHLLPPSLREWLPADHLYCFINDLVDQLDLTIPQVIILKTAIRALFFFYIKAVYRLLLSL